jgi:hypothetical protein
MPGGHGRWCTEQTCRHFVMVEEYRAERMRQEVEVENGGFRDETWRSRIITFRTWLRHYPWEREPEPTGEEAGEEVDLDDLDDAPWYPEWAS